MRHKTTVALVLGLAVAGCGEDRPLPLQKPLIFVMQKPVVPPQGRFGPAIDIWLPPGGAVYSTFSNFTGEDLERQQPLGSYLARLNPDGSLQALSPRHGAAARDPEVSYDGTRVVFSMRKGSRGKWQVYEVGADGTGLRRISRDDRYNDFEPAYLPGGRLLFLSDRPKLVDPGFQRPSAQLHTMAEDGSGLVSLSTEPGGELNPTLASDGRLLFTRWNVHYGAQLAREDVGFASPVDRFLVWKTALDGSSNAHPIFGEHVLQDFSGGFVHVREIPDGTGRLLATLADEYGTFGSGSIVRLDPRSHADIQTIEPLTQNVHQRHDAGVKGRYRSPYPLSDGQVVAVYAEGQVNEFNFVPFDDTIDLTVPARRFLGTRNGRNKTPQFKLVLLSQQPGGEPETLFESDDFWAFSPVELAARPEPVLDRGTNRPGFAYGILNAKDVYLRDRNVDRVVNGDEQPIPEPGEVSAVQLFVVDFVPSGRTDDPDLKALQERFLGEVPVEADGSFAAAVPAGVPLFWQTVRRDGTVVVQEPFLVEVRPGQVVTCNGCHSPHDGQTGRTTNHALARPGNVTGQPVDLNGNGRIDLLEEAL